METATLSDRRLSAVALAIIAFFLFHYFFLTANVTTYPWYHDLTADSDPTYAAQTVAAVNGGDIKYLHHPGIPVYSVGGMIYRVLGTVSPRYRALIHMKSIRTTEDALAILDLATRTGRIVSLFAVVLLSTLFYATTVELTGDLLVAFLVTFYVFLSEALLMYTRTIRPEIYSLIFLFLAALTILAGWRRTRGNSPVSGVAWMIAAGGFMSLALFSKVQVSALILVLCLVAGYLHASSAAAAPSREERASCAKAALVLALLNILMAPWWALSRPAFLTKSYVASIAGTDFGRLYGKAPPTFVPSVAALLSGFAVVAVLAVRKEGLAARYPRLQRVFLLGVCLLTGGILSIYLLLLPLFSGLATYIGNTNHVVYALLTNLRYGGFLENAHWLSRESFKGIWEIHAQSSTFLTVNPLVLACGTALLCGFRILVRGTRPRAPYFVTLVILTSGFLMDYFAALRWKIVYRHYAAYSLPFYALGIAYLIFAERGRESRAPTAGAAGRILYVIVLLCLAANALRMGYGLLDRERTRYVSDERGGQTPKRQLTNTEQLATPFWTMANEAIAGRDSGPSGAR